MKKGITALYSNFQYVKEILVNELRFTYFLRFNNAHKLVLLEIPKYQ